MSILKPVEKQRVAEEIVEQLRSLILTGQYPPGSKLPPSAIYPSGSASTGRRCARR
ncbi:MAG: GntR family transcriptional regulator [Myxococcales bacterium]|nr:GntR family transcriptional regulator [Myxococcales bacterium]